MTWLIWLGALVSLLGLAGLIYCIIAVMQARRQGLDDDTMKARLQKFVALNMAAMGVSAIGLMMVIMGIVLS